MLMLRPGTAERVSKMNTKKTAKKIEKRYVTVSVPHRDDEGADWFVYDRYTFRSVMRCATHDVARKTAREMNAK